MMRDISKDYMKYLALAYVLLVVVFFLNAFGYLSYFQFLGLMLALFGFASLYWGLYYYKKCEAFDTALKINFFVRKRNMEYYDTQRMIRDMGKWSLVIGVLAALGGLWIFLWEHSWEIHPSCGE